MMLIALTSLRPGKGQLEGMTLFAISTTIGQAIAGAIYTVLSFFVLRGERGNRDLLKTFDWPGFVLLSVGLGLIVIFLSEGERRFWFDKWWIAASLVCGLLSIGFAIQGMRVAKRPLLTLAILRKPTFSGVLVLQVIFRFGTLLALFIAPQYLVRLQGFRTEQLGGIMLVMAAATLLSAPFAYWVTAKMDPRLALSAGLGAIALAAAMCLQITAEWASAEFILPLVLAGAGQALFSVATMRYAVFGANLQDGPSHGIVFNVARTFGLVGGIALTTHIVVERQKFHWTTLGEAMTSLEPATADRLATMARALGSWLPDTGGAQRGAFAGLAQSAAKQAYTLAYQDAFFITAIVLTVAAILVWALPALPGQGTFRALPAPR
jgi:hypothetical protein